MTPEQEKERLIELFANEIRTSDFHVPEFITGVPCADGSNEYGKILEDETILTAKACAAICVKEIMKDIDNPDTYLGHWNKVLNLLNDHT